MKQFLIMTFVIMLTGCGGSTTSKDKQIDCEAEDGFGTGNFQRTFFGFTDDGGWSKLSDGEVTVTIKTNFSKGEFMKNDMEMVPYIKSGNTFTPKHTQFWDTFRMDENMDTSGNVVIKCIATMIVPKS